MTTNDTTIPEGHKRCTKCGEILPATEEYFHSHRGTIRPNCKACQRASSRKYYETHREERIRARRQYYETNLDKASESKRRSYKTHRDGILEYQHQYRINHREEMREYQHLFYLEHRECRREEQRIYRKNNPQIVRNNSRRRRSRLADLATEFTLTDENHGLKYFHGCCAVCGRPLRDLFGEHTVAFDHWIPLSDPRPDNPGTVPWNMVPLCHGIGGCNNSKHDRDPYEWLNAKFGSRKAKEIIDRIEQYFAWISNKERD